MVDVENALSLLDELLDFLVSTPTPEQIIALHPSKPLKERIHGLLEKSHQNALTPDESAELDDFLRFEQFLTLLKARARKKLGQA